MISYNATINRIQSPIPWNCSTPIGASFLCAPWEIRCMAASKAPWSMGLDTLRQPFKLDHFIGNTWLVQAPMLSGIYASWTIMNSCCDEKTWKYGVLLGFESYMNIVELDARCNATYSYSIIFIHVWHVLTACSTCHVLLGITFWYLVVFEKCLRDITRNARASRRRAALEPATNVYIYIYSI